MPPALERLWRTVAVDEVQVDALVLQRSLPRPLARVLVGRGLSDAETAERHLNPRLSELGDPFLLPAMAPAVERLWQAIRAREPVVVFGDYDVDGITSTALLVQVLRQLGAQVQPFLPQRVEEGYGLSMDALARCLETCQPRLIVTVDCGTSAQASVREAARLGVDVVVTDHHTPGPELAPAVALVNPKLGGPESLHVLAGVGVTFKLCHALLKRGRELSQSGVDGLDLRRHLDLVALGTIADIVPLVGENRILARHGLRQLNQTECPGLRHLIEVAGITGVMDAYEVGFRLGPRLNAAGRLGDAQRSLELLLGGTEERLRELAMELDATNRERQSVEATMVEQAIADVDARYDPAAHFALVTAHPDWHPGVVGIVASRLVQRYHRPTVVIGLGVEGGRGSGRSIEGFDLVGALSECAGHLKKFGGHTMAAGLEMEAGQVAAFAEQFNQVAARRLQGMDLRPVQRVDAWMDLAEADDRLWDGLEQLRPFGVGNTTPIWASARVRLVGRPRVVGKGHLKLVVAGGGVQREAMGWGMGDRALPDGPLDITYQLKRDHYLGQDKLVLTLQDFRPAGTAP
jgi:single-stranded-DNA-specific exonuclease